MRKKDIVPGVVYSNGMSAIALQVMRGELLQTLHTSAGGNVIINLKSESSELNGLTVRIKDMQYHILTDQVIHVDFQVVDLSEKIKVKVHLYTKGECAGVRDGGMLEMIHHEVEVECLPTEIPERIDINIAEFTIGSNFHVKELILPEGVLCVDDPEMVLFVILAPRIEGEKVEGEEAEETGEKSAEPEVIKKGKEAKEGEEGEG